MRAFSIVHRDKNGETLLAQKANEVEALTFLRQRYTGMFMDGRDFAVIYNPDGKEIYQIGVDWMTLVPLKTFGPFQSSSSDALYTVQINDNGIISCNCQGWTMWTKPKQAAGKPRECKHIKQVIVKERLEVHQPQGVGGRPGQYLFVVDKALKAAKEKVKKLGGTPMEIFTALVKEYENAQAIMVSLDPGPAFFKAMEVVAQAKFKVEAYMDKLESLGLDGSAVLKGAQA